MVPEIEQIGFEVAGGRTASDAVAFQSVQGHVQRLQYDRIGQFILQFEQVLDASIEVFRPQMESRLAVDQLCSDPEALTGTAHAAFENRAHFEFARDFTQIDVSALVGKRRGPRRNVQPRYASERVNQLFGETVAEVLLVRIPGRFAKGRTAIELRVTRATGSDDLAADSATIVCGARRSESPTTCTSATNR